MSLGNPGGARSTSAGDAGGGIIVTTLRKTQLDRATIGACRRLQEQVFNPDPGWDGSSTRDQFIPKPVAELTSGAALEAEIDLVEARGPASEERWHVVREGGGIIAKAQTHTRQLRVLMDPACPGHDVTSTALRSDVPHRTGDTPSRPHGKSHKYFTGRT
jgi:hypothetical protein